MTYEYINEDHIIYEDCWSRDRGSHRDALVDGRHPLRRGLEELLEEVAKGRYDGVVIWELPRAVRSRIDVATFKSSTAAGTEARRGD